MEEVHKKEIEKIIGRMECPRDFECYKSGFENRCTAKDTGIESFLKCLGENPGECKFSMTFGFSYFCKCPLCNYIVKKLKK